MGYFFKDFTLFGTDTAQTSKGIFIYLFIYFHVQYLKRRRLERGGALSIKYIKRRISVLDINSKRLSSVILYLHNFDPYFSFGLLAVFFSIICDS